MSSIKTLIDAYIKRNANQEITGPVLNGVLTAIADALGTPFIGEDGYWYEYDQETGEYVSSGTPAQGESGVNDAWAAVGVSPDPQPLPSVDVNYNPTLRQLSFTFYDIQGPKGDQGTPGITGASVSVDANVGTPSVDASIVNSILTLAFHNLRGAAAGFGTPTISVGANQGTPSASVTASGPDTAKVFHFAFDGLKGETGPQGPQGPQGNPGSNQDYPFTLANNLTTDDSTVALTAAMGVQLEGEVSQLSQEVNGGTSEETLISLTTKYVNIAYYPNPLATGESADLSINLQTSTWTRFLFATNNTESFAELTSDPSHYTGLIQTKTVGVNEYQVTAPDPVTFPYIGILNPGDNNSVFLTREQVVRGIVDDIEDLQDAVVDLQADVSEINETIGEMDDSVILDESGVVSNIQFVDNPLKEGDAFNLSFILGAENWTRFAFSKNNTGTDWETEYNNGNLYFFKAAKASNSWDGVAPDPTIYPYLMFQKPSASNELTLTRFGRYALSSSIKEIQPTIPLRGKKVLMLGDSITQLPRTGADITGNGIVEYFAKYSCSETIRGAFGGSHIRARRILETAADITDINTAKAAFDVVYIVKALCEQDWTLQDAAITWMTNNNSLDAYWPTILADLKALDMSTLDVLTIFAGTNDYANNVLLNDNDSTPASSTDIQRENGAWNYILPTLANTYKNLSVFVFTPIVKVIGGVWCEDTTNTRGLTLSDYAENNLAAAKRFQYPGCDLFYTMGWNRYNFLTFAPDGTHPVNGFDCLARKMAGFITSNLNR